MSPLYLPLRSRPSLWCLWLLAAGWLAFPLLAAADKMTIVRSFDIPPDVADKSLRRFAVQAAVEVVFGTETTAKIKTNAIKGDFTPRQAIERLLEGTGLIADIDHRTGALTVSRHPNG